jgi:serine/threonine protein kinase
MSSEHVPPVSNAGDPVRSVTLEGRYRVIGPGVAAGEVVIYAAVSMASEQPVALAVLRGDGAADVEFVTIAREQAGRLAKAVGQQRNLVRVYETGLTDEGELFVALEPVVGRSLREVLDERGVLPARDAVRLAIQIGEGLETLHWSGIVHGELRPESVLLTQDEDGAEIARLVGVELTAARRTPTGRRIRDARISAYLAPEQINGGDTTEASDVHALGNLLVEMMTGQRPDGRGRRGPAEIPPAIARIVAKATEPGPGRRYSGISLMVNDLWSADNEAPKLSVASTQSPESAAARRTSDGRRARSDVGMAAALVVGLVLVGVTAWVVRSDRFVRRAAVESTEPLVAASPVEPPKLSAPAPAVSAAPGPTPAAPVTLPPAPATSREKVETVETRTAVAKRATVGAVSAPKQAQRPTAVDRPSAEGADGTAIIDWLLKGGRSGG